MQALLARNRVLTGSKPALPAFHTGTHHATQTTALCQAPQLLMLWCASSKGKCTLLPSQPRRQPPLQLAMTTGFSASARYGAGVHVQLARPVCVRVRMSRMPHFQAHSAILCPPCPHSVTPARLIIADRRLGSHSSRRPYRCCRLPGRGAPAPAPPCRLWWQV